LKLARYHTVSHQRHQNQSQTLRSADEVATMTGRTVDGRIETVRIVPEGSPVANCGFDVTPARLVSGLITERGVLQAEPSALARAFPERAGKG
jgi:methylthioribose-1-phosphate isomerase